MDNQQTNYLVATLIMGFEPVPGREGEVFTPGMVMGNGSALQGVPMKPYDYCGRIDLAFDVAKNIRDRVNKMTHTKRCGLAGMDVAHLTLVDCGDAWAASFLECVDNVPDWWDDGVIDRLPYSAKDINPATAIVAAALASMWSPAHQGGVM